MKQKNGARRRRHLRVQFKLSQEIEQHRRRIVELDKLLEEQRDRADRLAPFMNANRFTGPIYTTHLNIDCSQLHYMDREQRLGLVSKWAVQILRELEKLEPSPRVPKIEELHESESGLLEFTRKFYGC